MLKYLDALCGLIMVVILISLIGGIIAFTPPNKNYGIEDSIEANVNTLALEKKQRNPELYNLELPNKLLNVIHMRWRVDNKKLEEKLLRIENEIIAEKSIPSSKVYKAKDILWK